MSGGGQYPEGDLPLQNFRTLIITDQPCYPLIWIAFRVDQERCFTEWMVIDNVVGPLLPLSTITQRACFIAPDRHKSEVIDRRDYDHASWNAEMNDDRSSTML